jgi:hypothetical protein
MRTLKEKMLDVEEEANEVARSYGLQMMHDHEVWFNRQIGLADDANEDPMDIEISDEKLLWLIEVMQAYIDENT